MHCLHVTRALNRASSPSLIARAVPISPQHLGRSASRRGRRQIECPERHARKLCRSPSRCPASRRRAAVLRAACGGPNLVHGHEKGHSRIPAHLQVEDQDDLEHYFEHRLPGTHRGPPAKHDHRDQGPHQVCDSHEQGHLYQERHHDGQMDPRGDQDGYEDREAKAEGVSPRRMAIGPCSRGEDIN